MDQKPASQDLIEKYNLLSAWKTDPVPALDFECQDGWNVLLEKLITDLIALGWNRKVAQVKEKFGGLRFYTGELDGDEGYVQAILDRISKAESDSYKICEICGEVGQLRPSLGWVKVKCEEHFAEAIAFRKLHAN